MKKSNIYNEKYDLDKKIKTITLLFSIVVSVLGFIIVYSLVTNLLFNSNTFSIIIGQILFLILIIFLMSFSIPTIFIFFQNKTFEINESGIYIPNIILERGIFHGGLTLYKKDIITIDEGNNKILNDIENNHRIIIIPKLWKKIDPNMLSEYILIQTNRKIVLLGKDNLIKYNSFINSLRKLNYPITINHKIKSPIY